jgi:hypothetical protein
VGVEVGAGLTELGEVLGLTLVLDGLDEGEGLELA